MWLLFLVFLIWVSTSAHLCISFAGSADDNGNIANFMFVLAFFFCGEYMPGRVYLDSGRVSAGFRRHQQLPVLQHQGDECISCGCTSLSMLRWR